MTTNLSPAAQAVFWAFNSKFSWIEDGVPGPQFKAIAAALRAVADQVVPKKPTLSYPEDYELGVWVASDDARVDILAIADELEATA